MKTKCYSVRLKSLVQISARACKATAFDGSTAILPLSQIFGEDFESGNSDAYWISEWILMQKDLQYSTKKCAWYDSDKCKLERKTKTIIKTHIPERVEPIEAKADDSLVRTPIPCN